MSARQPFRIATGGLVDRDRTIGFTFDGRDMTGHPGDTLASALIANGVHLVGRGFKYHRPRGIVSAGPEEPSALVQLGGDRAATDPNMRATQVELFDGLVASSQNRWPSLERDIGAINDVLSPLFPAGFYYKTFMWPASLWSTYEKGIRRAAGLGRAPEAPDPDRYDQMHLWADVVVIGGGVAGLAAALAAGRTGARVVLVDEQSRLGGWTLAEGEAGAVIDGLPARLWAERAAAELDSLPEVRVLTRTTAFGYYHHNFLGLLERVSDHLAPGDRPAGAPRQRLWKVRARRVVLATGSIERMLVFPENDRPGIMLAGAARAYANRWGVVPGRRAVVLTNNDTAYAAAADLAAAGVDVEAIVDLREAPAGPLVDRARAAGIEILAGHTIVATEGRHRVHTVQAMRLDAEGTGLAGRDARVMACDHLLVSGGWNPTVHLFSQSRGKLLWDEGRATFKPGPSFQAERSAGASAGAQGFAEAIAQGFAAGAEAATEAGFAATAPDSPAVEEPGLSPQRNLWLLPADRSPGRVKAFVDFQSDVTAKDLKLALREGYTSIEHVKRYTTTGMGTDQGKIGNINALGIVAGVLGTDIPQVGVTTFRPPYTPVTFGAVAGRKTGARFDVVRTTPLHAWHVDKGAVFENVGQWKRAWYYPKPGEDLHAAVAREAKAARTGVGLLDATTLGKIDVQGRDAAEFLNRVYTNAWSLLGVGRCRYGLMAGEDGMVMDDGVTARLGENHFHMTTTTGGAAKVMQWLEEWRQTEWPELKVHLTSVTEQWAVISLCGPNSRALMGRLTDDIDLSPEAFGFMEFREGHVAGVPARVFRISFTGELSYEINVPASYGLAVLRAVETAGRDLDLTPYGTETMHVLRAEKGFIIAGQDTDGTVTPHDLGMDWAVSKKKDFLGKRSLTIADMQRDDRKRLVGLLTEDPSVVLEEGAHLIGTATVPPPPVPMLGHVTSSYWSPNCGRSIALALVTGGEARKGERLWVAMPLGKPREDKGWRTIPVTVTDTVFFDPEGARLNGVDAAPAVAAE